MTILLFEDEGVAQLLPLTLGKPAFALSCAAERLIDLLRRNLTVPVRGLVRPHLRALEDVDYPALCASASELTGPGLLLNARLVPAFSQLNPIRQLLTAPAESIWTKGKTLVAARVSSLAEFAAIPPASWFDIFHTPAYAAHLADDWDLFDYPHDILRFHQSCVAENLTARIAAGTFQQLQDGLFVGPNVRLPQQLVCDTRLGPILIERDASIGPFCYLRGPLYIGAAARIMEHAALKDGTCLGHTTKVGGEVESSMLEPFSNKQHHGFLGHSYVGSWVNLGAGTSNSDLKNTYGIVNMQYRGQKVNTGLQFIGCMIGDYAKTAINTSIFTGKVIGACSMVYGFVTGNVPSFVNYARSFGQVSEAPVEIMINTQKRMFDRRGREQRPCDIQLLRDMYELTRHEREDFGETLSSEPLNW
ncbi:MAG: putative sugar nucleotidyl transferase [Pirellulales bacterium]|nr:putative sugar nucleotidyl transferase [Pirellulales bacterium]